MAHFRLQTAEDDMKAACALLEAGLSAHACSAAQQCGVKAVEALWYLAGIDPWSARPGRLSGKVNGQPGW